MGKRHNKSKQRVVRVECPYCGDICPRVGGDVVYPHRPDLRRKLFYWCQPCDAYVGTHLNSGEPLGLPANRQLRHARRQAHDVFDPLWESGQMSRTQAYEWLATQLGISLKRTHIAHFNIEQCRQVIAAVRGLKGIPVKYQGRNYDATGTAGADGLERKSDADGNDPGGPRAA